MPRHKKNMGVRLSMRMLQDRVDSLEMFLRTTRCRAWIRADIRAQLLGHVSSIDYNVGCFREDFMKEHK